MTAIEHLTKAVSDIQATVEKLKVNDPSAPALATLTAQVEEQATILDGIVASVPSA